MFGWVARMLAVAALAPLALPARAVADQSFTTTGSITYTWQGDPNRGCAAEGLCGVQGSLILSPQGLVSSSGGSPHGQADVPIDTSAATVRVSDGPGAGECIDVPSSIGDESELVITRGGGGGLVGQIEPSLSSGRCAGPLPQDLAGVTLPARGSGGKHPFVDLSGSRSFAVGPFTGTLVSTLVVRAEPHAAGSESPRPGPVPGAAPARHKVLVERVTLYYRVASLPGALYVAFSGEPDPFCAALDSCGATGTLAFSLPGFQKMLVVQASRTVKERVSAGRAVADFRRGRLQEAEGGEPAPSIGFSTARAAETFSWPGGLHCQDASDHRAAQPVITAGSPISGGHISLFLNNPIESDVLRTHCPGPSDTDVFGGFPAWARTSIGVAQLLARHSVISLTSPGTFAGFGYVGSRSGSLRFSLTLERVRAGTVEVTRP